MQYFPIEREANHFQQAPTAQQLLAICKANFGNPTVVERVVELSAGFFNSCFSVELSGHPKMILRVAPGPSALVYPNERWLMRREYAVQPFLAPVCPLAPKTLAVDFTHRLIDRDYLFQTFIEGEVWGSVRSELSAAENDSIRRQLGRIARSINQVVGSTFGFPHPERGFALWSEALLNLLTELVADLRRLGPSTGGAEELVEWLSEHRALFDEIREPRLMHGDLWPQNVLIHRAPGGPEIVGILDSERAMWGDPLFEWIYHLGTTHPAYWEGYGERDLSEEARVRALLYKSIWLLVVCLEHHRVHSDVEGAYKDLRALIAELREVKGSR